MLRGPQHDDCSMTFVSAAAWPWWGCALQVYRKNLQFCSKSWYLSWGCLWWSRAGIWSSRMGSGLERKGEITFCINSGWYKAIQQKHIALSTCIWVSLCLSRLNSGCLAHIPDWLTYYTGSHTRLAHIPNWLTYQKPFSSYKHIGLQLSLLLLVSSMQAVSSERKCTAGRWARGFCCEAACEGQSRIHSPPCQGWGRWRRIVQIGCRLSGCPPGCWPTYLLDVWCTQHPRMWNAVYPQRTSCESNWWLWKSDFS